MFNNLKISAKLYLGFMSVVAITVFLGVIAIWNMNAIKTGSGYLAHEYVPEVELANSIERNSLLAMYANRAYGYTEKTEFIKEGKDRIGRVKEQLKNAEKLAKKATQLKKLKASVDIVTENVNKYDSLLDNTVVINTEMDKFRATLDESAAEYMEACNNFLAGQNKKMDNEINAGASGRKLDERHEKITLINDIIDLGNAARVAVWKAQARMSPEDIEEALPLFSEMDKKFTAIRKITYQKADLKELDTIQTEGSHYKNAMIGLEKKWIERDRIGSKRNDAGQIVLVKSKELAQAAVNATSRISLDASSRASSSSVILVVGLVVAAIVALLISVSVTRSITTTLYRIIESLNSSSDQIGTASAQLSSASQELSSMSNEQASSIEETSSSLEEMSGMVENNVGNAEQAVKLAKEVRDKSNQGDHSMEQLQSSMSEILKSNEQIENLVKVIGNIGEKTQIMDEIVFQTKLLSFNASVEAERAGEHGRGFAVVAQEVGNLAQMSGKSAQEISDIVKNSIKEAKLITTENKSKVETGNNYVQETATILKEITAASTTVSEGSNQVLNASKDQSTGIKQINTAMGQLDKATQENAATAEETASSAEELSAQAEVLRKIVGDLSQLVTGTKENQTDRRVNRVQNADITSASKVINFQQFQEQDKKDFDQTDENKFAPQAKVANDGWEKL